MNAVKSFKNNLIPKRDDIRTVEISELCNEYHRLSVIADSCCNKWNSDLHMIMLHLGEFFGKKGTPVKDIIKLVGVPNATEKELEYSPVKLGDNEKLLVYFWRGYHDFLYFVYENDKVKYSDWFMWGD